MGVFCYADLPLSDGLTIATNSPFFYRQVYTAERRDPACGRLEHLDHIFDLHHGRVAFIAAAVPIPTLSTVDPSLRDKYCRK
jgi:hypothetical protein